MDHTIADEYKSSLNDLNFNSKPLINMLTMLADENKKHAALIVTTIVNHINSTSPESKLPGLYLIDSIIKNLGEQYLKIFCQHIVRLFSSVFEKVDENTRSLMFKLRQTWTDILPNKVLYSLDLSAKKLDPAWPVTAKNPSKKILLNPKFLEGSVEEPKTSHEVPQIVPNITLKKEEDKIKQRQGEVLKQLLAKQEQLRQLELKKVQLTMKTKSAVIGSSLQTPSTSSNSFKQNTVWDPRMVKINTPPQNIPEIKTGKSSVLLGKSGSVLDADSSSHTFPDTGKTAPQAKVQSHSYSNNSKNTVPVQESHTNQTSTKDFAQSSMSQKKLVKSKIDKCSTSKGKFTAISKEKIHQEVKSSSIESSLNSPRKEDSFIRDEYSSSKPTEKALNPVPKLLRTAHKKKSIASDNTCKMPHIGTSTLVGIAKKKIPLLKIPKKSDRLKITNSEALTNLKDETSIKTEPLKTHSSVGSGREKKDKDSIHPVTQSVTISKSVDMTNQSVSTSKLGDETKKSFKTELLGSVKSSDIDINSMSVKDEDLRFHHVPLNEEATVRVPKRDIELSDSSSSLIDKTDPRKKLKSEDIENLNPEYRRTLSPLLFGSEDQDLRHSETNLKDWSSYKATHPDEYSPSPNRHENSDGRFRFRRHQFSESKYYYPPEQDRYGSGRYHRGRYFSRHSVRRPYFYRGRGRFCLPSPDASFMLDSLHRAEEKFRCGQISEADYMDLRRELQKAVQSMTLKFKGHFTNFQDQGYHDQNLNEKEGKPDYGFKRNVQADNIKIQRPSVAPPIVKPFVLDGKERLIHYVEDRALIILDNNEPRELTFKDEQRDVFIEGLAESLTLGFDGKSVEFAVGGKRHIIRLGVPGREIYVNSHPYEAQFGGCPVAVMLEDNCICKLRLSGPPPQVIIGDTPQYELFNKYHGTTKNENATLIEPSYLKEEQKLQTNDSTSSSSVFMQDVDMRQKTENFAHSDELTNKETPFYVQDMKDVDWRHVPAPSIPEKEENVPKIFKDSVSTNFEGWSKEDNENQDVYNEGRNNQSNLLESSRYEWKKPASPHNQPVTQEENINPTISDSQDNWYYNQQAKLQRRNDEYKQDSHLVLPPEKYPKYDECPNMNAQPSLLPSRDVIHFQDRNEYHDPRSSHLQTHMTYARRPSYPNRRMRGRRSGTTCGTWVPNVDRGSRHSDPFHNQHPRKTFPTWPTRSKALLPSPPYPPEFPRARPCLLQPPVDASVTPHETYESNLDLSSELVPPDSEVKSTEPTNPDLNVDVESLLSKLVAAGIIAKPFEPTVPATSETTVVSETSDADAKKDDHTSLEEILEIEFTPENLRVHYPSVISALHKGMQCATCGMRFKEMQNDHYSRHLDWHFRMNRREKDGAKKAISRRWNYELEDWIQFEEFEDFEERIPSYFELEADNQQIEVPEVPTVISVPATSNDEEACPVCSERFQLFWVEDEEEWHFRDAVRYDDVTYHPACYEDFKKVAEAEKAAEAEKGEEAAKVSEEDKVVTNLENSELEVYEIVVDHLNSILDDVCEIVENEVQILDASDNNVEVPSEIQLEEEILEGKPGEEEIIGVITESDMEVDIPKTESKMVVMQSGGITLKVKAESLQCHSPSNPSEKDTKPDDDKAIDNDEIIFRPPTPDPNFTVRPTVSRGRELSGLCSIM